MPSTTNRDKIEDPCTECKSKQEAILGHPCRKRPCRLLTTSAYAERHVKCSHFPVQPRGTGCLDCAVLVSRLVMLASFNILHLMARVLILSKAMMSVRNASIA